MQAKRIREEDGRWSLPRARSHRIHRLDSGGEPDALRGLLRRGLGPVFWLLIPKIYPLKVRGSAMSVATVERHYGLEVRNEHRD
jgi:hypothetical protein